MTLGVVKLSVNHRATPALRVAGLGSMGYSLCGWIRVASLPLEIVGEGLEPSCSGKRNFSSKDEVPES